MSVTSLQDAQDVIGWIKSNNGHFNTDLLEIRPSPLGGIGVFAKQDIQLTEDMPPPVLLRLHKDSLLSSQKSCVANLLYESQITGALALVIAFIYELELKELSPWWGFIKSIKYIDDKGHPILPPSAWSKNEKDLFQGSEIEMQGYLSVSELLESYEKACLFAVRHSLESKGMISTPDILAIQTPQDEDIVDGKFQQFIAISHALASRNFEIDAFHEVALVPGADLFNHTNEPSVRFESVYEVCEACGAFEGGCEHVMISDYEDDEDNSCQDACCGGEEHEQEHEQESEDDDDENMDIEEDEEELIHFEGTMEEFITHIEQEIQEEIEENRMEDLEEEASLEAAKKSGINIELYSPEIKDIDGKIIHPNACVDITLTRSVSKGEEIFNTYGELSNVVLLNKYGFVIEQNEFDTVSLGDAFGKLRRFRKGLFRAHFKWWEERGYDLVKRYLQEIASDEEEEDEENDCNDGCCSDGDEDSDNRHGHDHQEDGCCGGDEPHSHGHDGEQEQDEDEEDEENSWDSNLDLLSTSEPNAICLALLRLLTLHKVQLIQFVKRGEELIPWLLKPGFKNPAMSRRMQRIWRDVLSFRLQEYEYCDFKDVSIEDLEDVRDDRLQFIKSIVGHEYKILERALDRASIM
ncbi:hypothetical protein WICPIJ_009110 [Wickerhamomyces pijperi]|uniref:SET domain-containing protein n=1 Tax=Wickerhamomyces pijperi TaxID=599730 RepID=A0A9P8PSE8_WICPI|nr:hypothetical protein WICPIJ_009110 [Wickerhamomyces pijperi]